MNTNEKYKEIIALEAKLRELGEQRKTALQAFQKDLSDCLETHQKLFFGLSCDEGLYRACAEDDLISVTSDGITLFATFGLCNEYEVKIPARYLMPDGVNVMEKEAIALADAQS